MEPAVPELAELVVDSVVKPLCLASHGLFEVRGGRHELEPFLERIESIHDVDRLRLDLLDLAGDSVLVAAEGQPDARNDGQCDQ
jgi:hypothetical protein